MSPAKRTSTRSTSGAKKKPTTRAAAKKAIARSAAGKGSVRATSKKKTSVKKTTTKKTTAKKTTTSATKKTTAKKSATRKAAARPESGKATAAKAKPRKPPAKTGRQRPAVIAQKAPAKGGATSKRSTGAPRGSGSAGGGTTRSRPVRAAKFDKKQLADIRARLEGEQSELERQIREIEEASFDGSQSDMSGEVGMDDDFADAGSATFERERDLSIQNNMRDLIDQISRAVRRIDDGVYGTCERCGKPIDAARLKALPHASLCMDCKRREERAR